jgi:hypothetical protein
VQLELSSISYKDISVPFSVSGDAELDSDYSISASPVFFPAGSESAYITITVFEDDDITELDEEIIISLLAADNAALGTPDVHTATIGKEATTPSVRFSSSSQTVSEGATNPKINIRVQLDKAATRDVSVPFSVGGTAVRGTDFTVTSSPVVIPAGGAFVNITLTLMNDLLYEADETIVLTMGTPDNAFKGSPNVHTVTVTDDDAFPTVSFASGTQTVSENAGTRPLQIQLSAASGLEVQVPFTVSGTASQGSDYTVSASPVVIPAGSTSATITLTIINDTGYEPTEQVTFTLGAPTNAVLGSQKTHQVMIIDDDPACPTSSSIVFTGPGTNNNALVWTLDNAYPLVGLKLLSVTINWPAVSKQASVSSITFGSSTLYSGGGQPPNLTVNFPSPLWSGTFSSNQLIYKFNVKLINTPEQYYTVSATFENCAPIDALIASP